MYLSKIEILGFKSFAQKTNLTFDAGITSIVGPNGCGKTNVVDAIRWALGEQKPTTLRSDKMEDVIFNGTKSRKPLSMAEVSLTIENTKGILPTEYSEVTITRRVYRSGESEYYLNKTLCRLKDIRDLFMDTGMGSDAYSVIELKMVETILSDKADERRRLFEEAAGVTKYKHRRKEAYRRLDSVQVDLTRVTDIVREVQKAVNSLERQAQKAERYNAYAKELHELEQQLLRREFASIHSKVDPLQGQLNVAVGERDKIDVELRQEEALLDVLRTEMRELEDRSAEAQTALSRQLEIVHTFEQSIATGEERRRALRLNIERYEKERVDLTGRRERLEGALRELRADLEQAGLKTAEAEEIFEQKNVERESFERQVVAKKTDLKTQQDRVISLLLEVSDLRNTESQARARTDNLKGRIEFIAEENASLEQEIVRNTGLVTSLSAEDRDLRRKFAGAEVRVHEVEDELRHKQEEIESLRERDFKLREDVGRKQTKLDFLRGLVESHDGLSEGTKSLMQTGEWGGTIETVAGEAVSVDAEYRVAIETALGESAGYAVVDTIDTAYRAIEYLKTGEKGKATFICLDRLSADAPPRPQIRKPGVIGWASDLLTGNKSYARMFRFLLDGCLIVRDLESAREVGMSYPDLKCVTLEGEIATGKGVVRGGSKRTDEGGSIGRQAQIGELEKEIGALELERKSIQAKVDRLTADIQAIDVKQLKEEAREIEQQTTTVEVRIAQIEFEKKRAQESLEKGKAETGRLKEEIRRLNEELAEIAPALKELENRKSEAEQLVGTTASELETMEVLLAEFVRAANDANVSVLSLKAEHRSVEREIQHTEATIQSLRQAFEQRGKDITDAREEIDLLKTELEESRESLKRAQESSEQLREQKKQVDAEYGEKRSQVHGIELKLKDERMKHEGSLKAAHDLEFKIQELRMKADALVTRAKEEFEFDLRLETFDDNESYDFSAAREQVRDLKEKLRALGAVNFAAF
ncbi:MAG TPA: chromosome segregation protein SMC, partial [Bacteroidota bacterium]